MTELESPSVKEPTKLSDVKASRSDLLTALTRHIWVLPLAILFGLVTAFVTEEWLQGGFARGTTLLGMDLSHLDRAAAVERVKKPAASRLTRPLTLVVAARKQQVTPAELGIQFDVEGALDEVQRQQHSAGVARRFLRWLGSTVRLPPPLLLRVRFAEDKLETTLGRVEQHCLTLPFFGGVRVERGKVQPDYPRAGQRIDRNVARARLADALAHEVAEVELPVVSANPEVSRDAIDQLVQQAKQLTRGEVTLSVADSSRKLSITREELLSALAARADAGAASRLALSIDVERLLTAVSPRLEAVENPAVSARFEITAGDRVHIVPSVTEQRVDRERLEEALFAAAMSENRSGELPLVRLSEPELPTQAAEALGIRGLVSTFTTRHPCCERRVDNIHRIADLLDGLLVKPGETVSVNTIVGPRTAKNGFVPAPTIEEGEMVETLGGGISQFATTLFNALFYGGYDIIERQPHSYWFPRYPMGHEATLSYPKPDLIFKNDTQAGMLFDMVYTKTTITVRIFGDNGGRRVEAKVSPRQNILPEPVEILPNPEVPPDKEHTLQAGMIGWTVTVGRVIHFPDGTQREEGRKVTYRPKVRRVEVHPCRVPEGEKGYTGEKCPVVETEAEEATLQP